MPLSSKATRPFDLAIFDFDGTLADSFGFFVSSQARLAHAFGFRPVAPGDAESLRTHAPADLMRRTGLPAWKLPLVARAFRRLMREEGGVVQAFAGIDDVLEDLQRHGIMLALVSSNAADNCRRVLGERSWGHFRAVECGVSIFGKQRRLQRVARRLRVPPGRAIYVGDQVPDAQAARAAGMAFGAVAWGYAHPGLLQREAPDHVFVRPSDLLQLVRA